MFRLRQVKWPAAQALVFVVGLSAGAFARDLPAPSAAMLDAVRASVAHGCNAQTASALDAMGFQPDQIEQVRYYNNSVSADVGRSAGLDAYVKIKGQSGSLVIQHRGGCSVEGAYASGGVRIPRRL